MKNCFVKTENYMRFKTGITAVEQRGAKEAGMMLVEGKPGLGKSTIIYHWATEADAVFLRANQGWTPPQFLGELAKALQLEPEDRKSGQYQSARSRLFERLLEYFVDRQRPLVIDEAEFTLHNNAAVLEKIRDISDRAEVSVVLIGMKNIQKRIARFGQISSRIAQVVTFMPATLADVTLACAKLCDYSLSPELASEVYRLSDGRMRDVLNILAELERLVKANGLTGTLDVSHFAGVSLAHDWQSGTARKVKAVAA